MDETEALLNVLKTYAEAESKVSQSFYQGLCIRAGGAIEKLQAENEQMKKTIVKCRKLLTIGKNQK